MSNYFKTQYKPFYEQWKSHKKNSSVLPSLVDFVNSEFKDLLPCLAEKARIEFIDLVKLLVFSHRHNKNDECLKNPLIDFSIVREPMYKYSRHAQDRFFEYCTFAFLFAWYEANPLAREFSAEKFAENENSDYPERMTAEIALLADEARAKLATSGGYPTTASPKYRSLIEPASANIMRRTFESYLRNA